MGCNCNGDHDHKHDHDHGECQCHGDHHHEDAEMMYLTLEDGSELECEIVVGFEVDGKDYIVLLPEGEETVFIYGYQETEEGPVLSVIEDDDEFEKVAEVYDAMLDEEFEDELEQE
ncbi:DUF1292 domain-containing protein [Irregularibacter muris]|uniref:UPF0473 protein NSA47_05885 n=1 Tax=Irregularibacter muris TaxID=1796619 RepID=A0AAE3HDK2_9FIRM|nr:DUF1292 domain-containing protein [Irregularibacter muris]MCR1898521.1 DUF1292 domain-containing protein [Irregularibacter muris]